MANGNCASSNLAAKTSERRDKEDQKWLACLMEDITHVIARTPLAERKTNSDIHKIYPPIVLSRVEMKIFVREALCMQKIGVYCAIRCSWTAKWGQLCSGRASASSCGMQHYATLETTFVTPDAIARLCGVVRRRGRSKRRGLHRRDRLTNLSP